MASISKNDSVIDSREVIERIEELQGDLQYQLQETFDVLDAARQERRSFLLTELTLAYTEDTGPPCNFAEWLDKAVHTKSARGLDASEYIDLRDNERECPEPDLDDVDVLKSLSGVDIDDREELIALLELQAQCEGYASDWRYGETIVRGTYFKKYAWELAEACGMVPKNLSWPLNNLDWDAAAEELKQDYTSADFGGIEYWIRCS